MALKLFSCFRQGEAINPDAYATAVTEVLSMFPEGVVRYIASPITGLPGSSKWLPSVSEIKQACIDRQTYLNRMADYDRRYGDRRPLFSIADDYDRPGRRANVFVHADAPQYARCVELTKTAESADWRYEDGKAGIWVSLSLFDGLGRNLPQKAGGGDVEKNKEEFSIGSGEWVVTPEEK